MACDDGYLVGKGVCAGCVWNGAGNKCSLREFEPIRWGSTDLGADDDNIHNYRKKRALENAKRHEGELAAAKEISTAKMRNFELVRLQVR